MDLIRLSSKRARSISPDKVERYRRLYESDREFPPIRVARLSDGTFDLVDGRHRLIAQLKAGIQYVHVKVINQGIKLKHIIFSIFSSRIQRGFF